MTAVTLTDGSLYIFEHDDTCSNGPDETIRKRFLTRQHLGEMSVIRKFIFENQKEFDLFDYRKMMSIAIRGDTSGYSEQLTKRFIRRDFLLLLESICYNHLITIYKYLKEVHPDLNFPNFKKF
jgi:hypothetical protein